MSQSAKTPIRVAEDKSGENFDIKRAVFATLSLHKEARNSDYELIRRVLLEYGIFMSENPRFDWKGYSDAITAYLRGLKALEDNFPTAPNEASLKRYRRLLQASTPSLRADKSVKQARHEKSKAWKAKMKEEKHNGK